MAFYPAYLDAVVISQVLIPLLNTKSIPVTVSAIEAAGQISTFGYTGDTETSNILSPIKPAILKALLRAVGELRQHPNADVSQQATRVYESIRFRIYHPAKRSIKLQ
jgi:hypothetical protein